MQNAGNQVISISKISDSMERTADAKDWIFGREYLALLIAVFEIGNKNNADLEKANQQDDMHTAVRFLFFQKMD